jgi:hypothetical protein
MAMLRASRPPAGLAPVRPIAQCNSAPDSPGMIELSGALEITPGGRFCIRDESRRIHGARSVLR